MKTREQYVAGRDRWQDFVRLLSAESLRLLDIMYEGTRGKGIRRFGLHPKRGARHAFEKPKDQKEFGYDADAMESLQNKTRRAVLFVSNGGRLISPKAKSMAMLVDVRRYREALGEHRRKARKPVRKRKPSYKLPVHWQAALLGGAAYYLLSSKFRKKAG